MENLNSTPFLLILIYLVLQTLFNLIVRIILVVGSFIIARKLSKWYGWCLLIGSSMFLICYIPAAPILSFLLVRSFSPTQLAHFSVALQILTNLALLVFSVGFIRLSTKFNRDKLRS
ncbi:MAG: hypothetical protein SWZ49_08305 [Cyanobacteriota bacterium]|nr:hypothetical protein [Cyanobacteriota bacterium]